MVCEHLANLEQELIARKIPETYRGRPWSRNCREWVYFDCFLDTASIRKRLKLDECVEDHVNHDTKSGVERGLACNVHHDAIVGAYEPSEKRPTIV